MCRCGHTVHGSLLAEFGRLSATLHSKEAPVLVVSPTLLTYVHAFLWRVNLPENMNMMNALGGICYFKKGQQCSMFTNYFLASRPLFLATSRKLRYAQCFLGSMAPNAVCFCTFTTSQIQNPWQNTARWPQRKTMKPAKPPGKLRPRDHVGMYMCLNVVRVNFGYMDVYTHSSRSSWQYWCCSARCSLSGC